MDKLIGKMLDGRYEILERIGIGGMAMVYKAKCHWLNRFVAVKILKEDLAQDAELRRRFHDESQAVAMLSHPNIVAVYDVSRSPELDYIVMELIDGISLKQYTQKRGGKLSYKEALHFITQIMKALSHAHGRGIIHRDIKPHNIMVLRDGSVKVADFGIARLMSDNQRTMTQEALGSVHYVSPEQAKGSRVDARSDIYSAGVVLYEMLTGRLPFEGDTPVAVAIQHINSIPLSPREIDETIPQAMEEITMKAMASNMDKRYASADAMLVDLEEFRKNPSIHFEYTSEDLRPVAADEPTRINSTGGGGTPPPVTTGGAQPPDGKTAGEEPTSEEEEYVGYGKKSFVLTAAVLLLCLVGVGAFLWNTLFSGMTGAKTYTVPDLEGYTVEEARALRDVTENGFTVIEGEYVISDTVEAGKIISQSPEADLEVKSGEREIVVEISAGGGGISMPTVYNQDERIAKTRLEELGLVVTVEEENSEDITEGNVIRQIPAEGETVKEGDTVTIVVSLGPKIPDSTMITLTGMELETAKRVLTEDLKLNVGRVEEVINADYAAGLVCFQSVAVGESVPEGTVVNLHVSLGPDGNGGTDDPEPSQPVASEPPVVRKEVVVTLPGETETVVVRITVGGVEQVNQIVDTKMRIARYYLEGSGSQEIVIYIDGVQIDRYPMEFS